MVRRPWLFAGGVFGLLLFAYAVLWYLAGTERFMAEVSGAADFRYVSGTASFYSAGETSLRIPRRISAVRISNFPVQNACKALLKPC